VIEDDNDDGPPVPSAPAAHSRPPVPSSLKPFEDVMKKDDFAPASKTLLPAPVKRTAPTHVPVAKPTAKTSKPAVNRGPPYPPTALAQIRSHPQITGAIDWQIRNSAKCQDVTRTYPKLDRTQLGRIVRCIIHQESDFNPKAFGDNTESWGLGQIKVDHCDTCEDAVHVPGKPNRMCRAEATRPFQQSDRLPYKSNWANPRLNARCTAQLICNCLEPNGKLIDCLRKKNDGSIRFGSVKADRFIQCLGGKAEHERLMQDPSWKKF
jgi:hypothetical protein